MTEQVSPLATFYKPGWEIYQHALAQTIAPLSSEQLALSFGADQRSIGELLEHMIGARFNWFHLWVKEIPPLTGTRTRTMTSQACTRQLHWLPCLKRVGA